ncbi:MAG TPA: glycosyltransferase [Thiolinea sp.]|nr:glycosyltransferase [Thiolinea sp.]
MQQKPDRIRVAYIITCLSTGGAEMMLYKLVTTMDQSIFEPMVIVLDDQPGLADRIRSHGIRVHFLNMHSHPASLWRLLLLVRLLAGFRPDVIQGWMYHGNLMAYLASRLRFRRSVLVWNIRQTLYDIAREPRMTRWTIRCSALVSSGVRVILYNAFLSARQHQASGFSRHDTRIIPNGFPTGVFRPDPVAGTRIRLELGIAADAFVIGMLARYHPMKNHALFLQAAARLLQSHPETHFILAGDRVTLATPALASLFQAYPRLAGRVHLLGERRDVVAVMNALDIFTLTSAWGEGFPNVLGEAMACGVPCMATDVGDAACLLGDSGLVLPDHEPDTLARFWACWMAEGPGWLQQQGRQARTRIVSQYTLEAVTEQYQELYKELVAHVRPDRLLLSDS